MPFNVCPIGKWNLLSHVYEVLVLVKNALVSRINSFSITTYDDRSTPHTKIIQYISLCFYFYLLMIRFYACTLNVTLSNHTRHFPFNSTELINSVHNSI